MSKKEPLYIFLHIPKCGGTTLKFHIEQNFKKKEIIHLGAFEKNVIMYNFNINNYLSSITKEKRDRIRVVYGHILYYGIHKFFPNREARYITFFRNPIDRTISQYNFQRTELKKDEGPRFYKQFILRNGEILNFKKWVLSHRRFQNFMFRFLFIRLFFNEFEKRRKELTRTKDVNMRNFNKMKKILKDFYFIGLTENPDDFLFLFYKMGMNKFYLNQNISTKYFRLNSEQDKEVIMSKNSFDEKLYKYAVSLNKKFKEKNKDFDKIIKHMKFKRKILFPLGYIVLFINNIHIYLFLNPLSRLSVKLRRKSKTYSKTLDFVKSKLNIP